MDLKSAAVCTLIEQKPLAMATVRFEFCIPLIARWSHTSRR